MQVNHPLNPIYDEESRVLILGTMPSLKSREKNFYYAHPRNRFWKVLSEVYNEKIGASNEEREAFLHHHHIALYDVLKSCDINSSSDASIKNPIPNDLTPILKNSKIKVIFTTGKKAYELYNKYLFSKTKILAISLPSTSPANNQSGIEEILKREYNQIKKYTEDNNDLKLQ